MNLHQTFFFAPKILQCLDDLVLFYSFMENNLKE